MELRISGAADRLDWAAAGGGLLGKITLQQATLTFTERPYVQSRDSSWSIEPRVIRDYDLFICTGGAAEFRIGGDVYRLATGGALLVPPETVFSARFIGPANFDAVAQHFTIEILGGTDLFSLIRYEPLVRFHEEWEHVSHYTDEYLRLTEAPDRPFACEANFLLMLGAFLRLAWRSDKPSLDGGNTFVVEIARLLDARYADDSVLGVAATLSPYSWDYTTRLFKEHAGVTPKQYLIRRRMAVARERLQHGTPVKEAAEAAGFRDELYFSRLFRRRHGVPPSSYRFGV